MRTDPYYNRGFIYDLYYYLTPYFTWLYNYTVWGLFSDYSFIKRVVQRIPNEDFNGVILDVPCGTGLFTISKYLKLSRSKIICLDLSICMLRRALNRFTITNNILCINGDIVNLPIKNSSIDYVISLNSLHAIENKQIALQRIFEVLKPNGILVGSTYIYGKRKLTDYLVRNYFFKKLLFKNPFMNFDQFLTIAEKYFIIEDIEDYKTNIVFKLRKKG